MGSQDQPMEPEKTLADLYPSQDRQTEPQKKPFFSGTGEPRRWPAWGRHLLLWLLRCYPLLWLLFGAILFLLFARLWWRGGFYSGAAYEIEPYVCLGMAGFLLLVSVPAWTFNRLVCSVFVYTGLRLFFGPIIEIWGQQFPAWILCTIGALCWMSLYNLHDGVVSPQVQDSAYLQMLGSKYTSHLWVTRWQSVEGLSPQQRRAPLATSFRVLAAILVSILAIISLAPKEEASHGPASQPHEAAEAPETQETSGIFAKGSGAEYLYRAADKIVYVLDRVVLAFVALMLFHPLSHAVGRLEKRRGVKLGRSAVPVVCVVLLLMAVMGEQFVVHRLEEAYEHYRVGAVLLAVISAFGPAIAVHYWMRAMQLQPRAMVAAPLASSVSMAALLTAPLSVLLAVGLTAIILLLPGPISLILLLVVLAFCAGGALWVLLFFYSVVGFLLAGPCSLAYAVTTRFAWRLPPALQLLVPVLVFTVPWVAICFALRLFEVVRLSDADVSGMIVWWLGTGAGWYFGMLIDPALHDCIRDYALSKTTHQP